MEKEAIDTIIKKLENKRKDCIVFSKKYQTRKMDDLFNYYEGAKWAIDYVLGVINESKEKS